MRSNFPMNMPTGICHICFETHAAKNPCRYDTLVKTVISLRQNMQQLQSQNVEAVDTAKAFQKLLIDITPETERLVAIEHEYRDLVRQLKKAEVHSFAPSKDPNKPSPLVGVSVDLLNEILPPDFDKEVDFTRWVMGRHTFADLKKEDHACSIGDCDHDRQSQCDETLEKMYGTGETKKLQAETPKKS